LLDGRDDPGRHLPAHAHGWNLNEQAASRRLPANLRRAHAVPVL